MLISGEPEAGRRAEQIESGRLHRPGCDSIGTCLFSNPSTARILGYNARLLVLIRFIQDLDHR
jgi:hypothetical protein